MVGGQILRDPHLQFGTQLGHLVMDTDGSLCISNARGTTETLCSARALEMQVRAVLARGVESSLLGPFSKDPNSVDFKSIASAVRKGDRVATDEFNRWTRNLGWMLVTAVHAFAPQIIILSGGASMVADLYLDKVREHVAEHIFRIPGEQTVEIVVSKIREHAGGPGCGRARVGQSGVMALAGYRTGPGVRARLVMRPLDRKP